MVDSSDDVSRLHNKYSITLVTPSSYWLSLVISMLIMACVITMSHVWYGIGSISQIAPYLAGGLVVLGITQIIDSRLIAKKEYSKALHQSLYGSLLWALILLSGLAAVRVLSLDAPPVQYVGIGMMIFVAFRLGMLTTTLGVPARKAWAHCHTATSCSIYCNDSIWIHGVNTCKAGSTSSIIWIWWCTLGSPFVSIRVQMVIFIKC